MGDEDMGDGCVGCTAYIIDDSGDSGTGGTCDKGIPGAICSALTSDGCGDTVAIVAGDPDEDEADESPSAAGLMACVTADANSENCARVFALEVVPDIALPELLPSALGPGPKSIMASPLAALALAVGCSYLVDHRRTWRYPGQVIPRLMQLRHAGTASSHLSRLALHTRHPERDLM